MGRTGSLLVLALAAGCALPHAVPSRLDATLELGPGPDAQDDNAQDINAGEPGMDAALRPDVSDVSEAGCGPTEGMACPTGMQGACSAGVVRCADAAPQCVPSMAARTEVCDGVDNDCDGTVDNSYACPLRSEAIACTTGCGTVGTSTCQGDCTRAACAPPPELCNLRDDNCDARCDEGCRAPLYQLHYAIPSTTLVDILYSPSATDGTPTYTLDGPALYVYPVSVAPAGTVPLYRCRNTHDGTHILSLATTCNGNPAFVPETAVGAVTLGPGCGAVPVYAAYCGPQGSDYFTLSAAVLANLAVAGCTPYPAGFWAWGP